ALERVRVPGEDEPAGVRDRYEQRAPDREVLEVDVAGVAVRCDGADRLVARGGETERSLKRPKRETNARIELDESAFGVQREILDVPVLEVVGKRSGADAARIVEVGAEIDRLEPQRAELHDVTRHRAPHGDRADDAVHAAPAALGPHGSELVDRHTGLQAVEEMRPRV